MEVKRFEDTLESIYDFGTEFLVVCPKCQAMAKVIPVDIVQTDNIKRCKLVCANCGLNKIDRKTRLWWIQSGGSPDSTSVTIGGAFDWYFKEPLWLQTECCRHVLWIYNEKHLDFVEGYVAASLRPRTTGSDQSLASRLPKWIKSAKNRDDILHGLKKLREKLDGKR